MEMKFFKFTMTDVSPDVNPEEDVTGVCAYKALPVEKIPPNIAKTSNQSAFKPKDDDVREIFTEMMDGWIFTHGITLKFDVEEVSADEFIKYGAHGYVF